jgi:hypothetical protein
METLLVRLKPHDPRRGHVLRRFTYTGIKFHEERGWYRVSKDVAEYLRAVKQLPGDTYAPPAFDVCTEDEAKALDAREENDARVRRSASDDVKLSPGRAEGTLTTQELADSPPRPASPARPDEGRGRRDRS